MIFRSRIIGVAMLGVFLAGLVCWTVSAQSQTPMSPQPYPQTGTGGRLSNRGLGGNMGGAGQLNSPLGGSSLGSGSSSTTGQDTQAPGPRNPVLERLRERDERRKQEADRQKTDNQKQNAQGQPAGGAEAAKTAAESPGAAKNPKGEQKSGAGKPTTVGGGKASGGGEQGSGGGGGAATFNKGSGGGVVMTGEGKFEPFLDRDVNYADVPDDGEPLTLEGPMPVGEFLSTISMATGWNIMVSPELQDMELKFWLNETRPRDALKVLQFYKIFYEFDKDTRFLRVMSEEDYLKRSFGKRKPEEFKVRHVDPTLAEQMLTSMLSSNGRLLSDQRTGTLYVWDAEDNLKIMREVFEKLDVPLEQREFTIRYADLPDIETVLSSMSSQSGNLLSDARTGQIIVWDTPAVLEQMAMVVERLDRPLETRTFELRHVNVEDITDSLESVISERGVIQTDPRYNTLMVSDLPQRLEKVAEVVAMLDRELETRTWVIQYADMDFLADEIEALVPESMGRVTINEDVHQLTVSAIPARLDEIDKLIKTWDVKRKQVFIEAYIVECTDEVERSFSINWSYYGNINGEPSVFHSGSGGASTKAPPGAGEALQFGSLPYAIPAYGALQLDGSGKITRPVLTDVNGKPITDRYAGNRLTAVLDYLDKQNKVTIISSPRVTVQDGEEAVFENATRVPYVSASTYYGGGGYYPTRPGTGTNDNNNNTTPYYPYYSGYGLNNTNRVDFIDVGTILSVYPRITDDGTILMDIEAEDSTFIDKDIKVNDQTSTIPEKTVRRAATQVRVTSGETIVLGGLRRDRAQDTRTKTPLLGDLPVLGKLFSSPSRSARNTSLLIFITPTVVEEKGTEEVEDLYKAQDNVVRMQRNLQKNFWKSLSEDLKSQNELLVAVGSSGRIYCAGREVTLESLAAELAGLEHPEAIRFVLRHHPAAPADVVDKVRDTARAAGITVTDHPGVEVPRALRKAREKAQDVPERASEPAGVEESAPSTRAEDARTVQPVTPSE